MSPAKQETFLFWEQLFANYTKSRQLLFSLANLPLEKDIRTINVNLRVREPVSRLTRIFNV